MLIQFLISTIYDVHEEQRDLLTILGYRCYVFELQFVTEEDVPFKLLCEIT